MIDEDTESLAVHYDAEVGEMLKRLRQGAPDARLLLRRLQPYLVSVRRQQAERYRQLGLIAEVLLGLEEWLGAYDLIRGLVGEDPGVEGRYISGVFEVAWHPA